MRHYTYIFNKAAKGTSIKVYQSHNNDYSIKVFKAATGPSRQMSAAKKL